MKNGTGADLSVHKFRQTICCAPDRQGIAIRPSLCAAYIRISAQKNVKIGITPMQMPQVYATEGAKTGRDPANPGGRRSGKLLSNAYKVLRQILKVGG
ncbi:MAG: hypothetical protein ACK4PN_11690 [Allorhizobium sp.]